jgi:radical SAM superfamily enzyme YgiQ (UPF0313 family)
LIQTTNKSGPVVLVSRQISYAFPISYAYLTGYLLSLGEKVELRYRPSYEYQYTKFVKELIDLKPLLVGFGNLYVELPEIAKLIKALDMAGRKFPIVIGGQMVTPLPEFSLEITGADIGVIGEGEIILSEIVSALRSGQDISSIKGLVINDSNQYKTTGQGKYIEDLKNLPKIPYEFFPSTEWLNVGRWYNEHLPQYHWRYDDRVIDVHGGRGCPFNCNFCYHHSKPRYRPIDDMMLEAADALDRFNANFLYFSDDLVICNPSRAKQLTVNISKLNRKVEYSVSNRIDILKKLDLDILNELKATGCRTMAIGIESGSDRILNIIGKKCTRDDVLDGIQRLSKVGITPTVAFMVGQHTETVEDAEQTVDLVKEAVRINPNINCAFSITTPFPGSPLYSMLLKDGRITSHRSFYEKYFRKDNSLRYAWKQVVNVSNMSDSMVLEMHARLINTFINEKRKKLPSLTRHIGKLQIYLGRIKKILSLNPINPFIPVNFISPLENTYNNIQKRLERKRLNLCNNPKTIFKI